MAGRQEKDALQNKKLQEIGYTIIRISDREIEKEGVDKTIKKAAIKATFHGKHVITWQ